MKQQENNFEFLVEYISAKVVERIIQDQGIELKDALLQFHNSETFAKLCTKSSGMYIESPAYVYEVYCEEFRRGSIRGLSD